MLLPLRRGNEDDQVARLVDDPGTMALYRAVGPRPGKNGPGLAAVLGKAQGWRAISNNASARRLGPAGGPTWWAVLDAEHQHRLPLRIEMFATECRHAVGEVRMISIGSVLHVLRHAVRRFPHSPR